jgi:hypothetical protein
MKRGVAGATRASEKKQRKRRREEREKESQSDVDRRVGSASRKDKQTGTHARTHARHATLRPSVLPDPELTSDGWLLVQLELIVHKPKNKTRFSNSGLT